MVPAHYTEHQVKESEHWVTKCLPLADYGLQGSLDDAAKSKQKRSNSNLHQQLAAAFISGDKES